MIVGAFLGGLVPTKGEGLVASIVIGSILGALIWHRRSKPVETTITASLAVIIVGWPLALVLLDWLHRYY